MPPEEQNQSADLAEAERTLWLNKIMRLLLPKRIFDQAHLPNYETKVQKWFTRNGLTIAQNGERMAVLRDGKVFAEFNPSARGN